MNQKVQVMEKVKKKGFPVGRLGAHVKNGICVTYAAFFRDYDVRAGLPHVGAGSIKP